MRYEEKCIDLSYIGIYEGLILTTFMEFIKINTNFGLSATLLHLQI